MWTISSKIAIVGRPEGLRAKHKNGTHGLKSFDSQDGNGLTADLGLNAKEVSWNVLLARFSSTTGFHSVTRGSSQWEQAITAIGRIGGWTSKPVRRRSVILQPETTELVFMIGVFRLALFSAWRIQVSDWDSSSCQPGVIEDLCKPSIYNLCFCRRNIDY